MTFSDLQWPVLETFLAWKTLMKASFANKNLIFTAGKRTIQLQAWVGWKFMAHKRLSFCNKFKKTDASDASLRGALHHQIFYRVSKKESTFFIRKYWKMFASNHFGIFQFLFQFLNIHAVINGVIKKFEDRYVIIFQVTLYIWGL